MSHFCKKDLMATLNSFEGFAHLDDDEIQNILRKVETEDLAAALKLASNQAKKRIFDNISDRVKKIIQDRMEKLTDISKVEIEEAQQRIVGVS